MHSKQLRTIVFSSLTFAFAAIFASSGALAWGGLGHRTVAAIAMALLPKQKVAEMDTVLNQLEMDSNFIDSASYPDEYVRSHNHSFDSWHFADLRDDGQPFVCGECLFTALSNNLAIVKEGKRDKTGAVAIAWVIHLVGDLHQPLHMSERLRGGNNFHVTYRGKTECRDFRGHNVRVELHSAWDDCLVEELANGRGPLQLAQAILGDITTYTGRSEIGPANDQPWLSWGNDSHQLANSIAFNGLQDGADLSDGYIIGKGKALEVVQNQLLLGGIRLAFLLDQNFK